MRANKCGLDRVSIMQNGISNLWSFAWTYVLSVEENCLAVLRWSISKVNYSLGRHFFRIIAGVLFARIIRTRKDHKPFVYEYIPHSFIHRMKCLYIGALPNLALLKGEVTVANRDNRPSHVRKSWTLNLYRRSIQEGERLTQGSLSSSHMTARPNRRVSNFEDGNASHGTVC